jgi:hypothetical protein
MELLNGFKNLKDVANQRVTGDLIPVVTDAVDAVISEHNKVTDDMLRLFTTRTTQYKIKYKQMGAAKLQPLDHNGRAFKVKTAGSYELAFPLRDAGIALGDTRIALVKKTVQEVNDEIALLLQADKRWLRDGIMAALLDNVGYTFSDEEYGDLAVKGLANGDSTEYLIKSGAESGTTANHFAAIAAMNDASQNFRAIQTALTTRPENAGNGQVITFIPTNLEDDVMGLASFIEETDPDITLGANTDRLTGSLGASVPGVVLGKVDRNWIVRWDSLPSDYMVSTITSGPRPLAMREHPESELQGFNRVANRDDDPYYESQYTRHAGFGAWNRLGAFVTKVDADTTYDIPTGYGVNDHS